MFYKKTPGLPGFGEAGFVPLLPPSDFRIKIPMSLSNKIFLFFLVLLELSFGLTSFAQFEGLMITEFMANPHSVSDNDGEWFEIFNSSSIPINLSGWEIISQNGEHKIEEEIILEPEKYFVLCKNKKQELNGGILCDYQYSSINLSNNGGTLKMKLLEKEFILNYPLEVVQQGKSMELNQINPFHDNSYWDWENWHLSLQKMATGDYGTPGEENSSGIIPLAELKDVSSPNENFSGDSSSKDPPVLINEILPNPEGLDNDSNEFIELYNPEPTVVSLKDWVIKNNKGESYFFAEKETINPFSYLLIYREVFDFAIFNTSENISLFNEKNILIDSLVYSGSAPSGQSLNKNSFGNSYWSLKITPGKENNPSSTEESLEKQNLIDFKKISELKELNHLPDLSRVEIEGEVVSPSGIPQNNSFYLQKKKRGILVKTVFKLFLEKDLFVKIKGVFHKSMAGNYLEVEKESDISETKEELHSFFDIKNCLEKDCSKMAATKIFFQGVLVKKSVSQLHFKTENNKLLKLSLPSELCLDIWDPELGINYKVTGVLEKIPTGVRVVAVDKKALALIPPLISPREKETVAGISSSSSKEEVLSSRLFSPDSPSSLIKEKISLNNKPTVLENYSPNNSSKKITAFREKTQKILSSLLKDLVYF